MLRIHNGIGAITLAGFALSVTVAGIPEPDVVLYGRVRINGALVHGGDTVTVRAREMGSNRLLGTYAMSQPNPKAGDDYALRIKLESLMDGAVQSADTALIGQRVRITVAQSDGPESQVAGLKISGRGLLVNWNLPLVPDTNADGVADLRDYARFQNCFAGPAGTNPSPSCEASDLNHSGRVDLDDHFSLGSSWQP